MLTRTRNKQNPGNGAPVRTHPSIPSIPTEPAPLYISPAHSTARLTACGPRGAWCWAGRGSARVQPGPRRWGGRTGARSRGRTGAPWRPPGGRGAGCCYALLRRSLWLWVGAVVERELAVDAAVEGVACRTMCAACCKDDSTIGCLSVGKGTKGFETAPHSIDQASRCKGTQAQEGRPSLSTRRCGGSFHK